MKIWGRIKKWFGIKSNAKTMKSYHNYYEAAKVNRLYDALGSNVSSDAVIRSSLYTLRARSRTLAENNEYVAGFIKKTLSNVVGNNGILLQSKVKNLRGKVDSVFNTSIEKMWKKFCRKQYCSISTLDSFDTILKLALRHLITDGEVIVRIIRGNVNQFNLALQVLEADHLDINHNMILPNGNTIKMGIETDGWGKPAAYWLWERHPEAFGDISVKYNQKIRIPASDVIHLFIRERASQTRGIPWVATSILKLHMLGAYEEAALIAARIGASQMGFFTSPAESSDAGYQGDDTDEQGLPIDDIAPGQFEKLPPGMDMKPFNPDYPHEIYAPFTKAMLRGVAVALGISYHSLASDLESASYSSMRSGALEERDQWSMVQKFIVENLVQPIAEEWTRMLMLTDLVSFKFYSYEKVIDSLEFQPRTWEWVDPAKDAQGKILELQNRLTSRTIICKEKGFDYEDVLRDIQEEKALEEQYQVTVNLQELLKPQSQSGGEQEISQRGNGNNEND